MVWTSHPTHVSPTVTYVSGRDFTFKSAGQVSVNTLSGRLVLSYQGWSRHVAWLGQGATIGGARLWYNRTKRRFYVLVSLTLDTPDPTPADVPEVVGIDLGQRSSFHPDHATQSHPVLLAARR
jgi:putative transposase